MSLEQTQRNQNSDRDAQNAHYRLQFYFGDLQLFSEWEPELAPVENLAEQLVRDDGFHDVTIERRTEVRR